MANKQNIEEVTNSFLTNFINKIKPIHALYALIPIIIFYPKPLMLILKPMIRNWSFYYRNINNISSKPTQIILTCNQHICFTKKYLKNFKVLKGTLPQGFKIIQQQIMDEEQIRKNQDQSMKHALFKTKYELKKQKIFRSCYMIDMYDICMPKTQKSQKNNYQVSTIINQRKNSHSLTIHQIQDNSSIYNQTDYVWVQMILMKLKLLHLQNNSEVIKYVIIKANQKVLQILQSKILGLKESQTFKLGTIGPNKIHLLKFNKYNDTYEQCSTTFKIQQTSDISQKLHQS